MSIFSLELLSEARLVLPKKKKRVYIFGLILFGPISLSFLIVSICDSMPVAETLNQVFSRLQTVTGKRKSLLFSIFHTFLPFTCLI